MSNHLPYVALYMHCILRYIAMYVSCVFTLSTGSGDTIPNATRWLILIIIIENKETRWKSLASINKT